MQSRRRFLRLMFSLPVASGLALRPRSAISIDFATGLAIANSALSAARLFGPSGGSVAELLNLQTQLLNELSQQISALNKGIVLIVDQLEDIRGLIGKVPESTVFELYRNRLAGITVLYRESMELYSDYRVQFGIEAAQSKIGDRLEEEILKPLREIRSVFLSQSEDIIITPLAVAAKIETHCMIMSGYSTPEQRAPIKSYLLWCEDRKAADDSLEVQLASNRQAKETIQKERKDSAARHYALSRRFCLRGDGSFNVPVGPCHIGGGFYGTAFRYTTPRLVTSNMVNTPQTAQVISALTEAGYFEQQDWPLSVSMTASTVDRTMKWSSCFQGPKLVARDGTNQSELNELKKYLTGHATTWPNCHKDNAPASVKDTEDQTRRISELQAALGTNHLKTVSLQSLRLARDSLILSLRSQL